MNRHLAVMFCCLVLLTFSIGCNSEESQSSESAQNILLILKTRDNPFFASVAEGVRAGLDSLFVESNLIIRAGETESDVTSQRKFLEQFYQQYAREGSEGSLAGVLLTPSGSSQALTTYIQRFRDKGVPVILVDTKIEAAALEATNSDYDAFVGSDNYQGGRLAADLIHRALPRGGRILQLNGAQGHETAEARRRGFSDGISELSDTLGVDYEIIERTASWRRSEPRSIVDGMLSLGQTIDGIFAANDQMALGAVEAMRQHNQVGSVPIVGFDAIDEAVAAVKDGVLFATIAQNPYEMGRRAATVLHALVRDETVKKDTVIPVAPVLP